MAPATNPEAPADRCARCGAAFTCGMRAGEKECWCASLPPLVPVAGRSCLCRDCLLLELKSLERPA